MTYLRKREVAELLRMHPGTVMRLVKKGVLPKPIKLVEGGPCLFDEAAVERAVAKAEGTP